MLAETAFVVTERRSVDNMPPFLLKGSSILWWLALGLRAKSQVQTEEDVLTTVVAKKTTRCYRCWMAVSIVSCPAKSTV